MTSHAPERSTVTPDTASTQAVKDLRAFLEAAPSAEGRSAPYLVSPDGRRQELPYQVFDLLADIVGALSEGKGVSVVPTGTRLTTQQAADFLGISRPTLVGLLEKGDIPFTKVGRHRRVKLPDLLAYETSLRQKRGEALADQTREAAADGTYFDMPADRATR